MISAAVGRVGSSSVASSRVVSLSACRMMSQLTSRKSAAAMSQPVSEPSCQPSIGHAITNPMAAMTPRMATRRMRLARQPIRRSYIRSWSGRAMDELSQAAGRGRGMVTCARSGRERVADLRPFRAQIVVRDDWRGRDGRAPSGADRGAAGGHERVEQPLLVAVVGGRVLGVPLHTDDPPLRQLDGLDGAVVGAAGDDQVGAEAVDRLVV